MVILLSTTFRSPARNFTSLALRLSLAYRNFWCQRRRSDRLLVEQNATGCYHDHRTLLLLHRKYAGSHCPRSSNLLGADFRLRHHHALGDGPELSVRDYHCV